MSDRQTVLGRLMQMEAELSQTADDQREASWIRISEAIDEIERVRRSGPMPSPQMNPVPDEDWNPKTAFNPKPTPPSVWRFPNRRMALAMFAVVLGVAAFLAGVFYLQTSGILPGPTSTVTLTDEPIPIADPTADLPNLDQLMIYLDETDSRLLINMAGQAPDAQKATLEQLAARNNMQISRLDESAQTGTIYWIARKTAADEDTDSMLVLIAREKTGESGWQVIYPIMAQTAKLPTGALLDDYFSKQLARR